MNFDNQGLIMLIAGTIMAVAIIGYYGFSGEDTFMAYEYTTYTNTTDAAFSSSANGTIIAYGVGFGRLIDDEDDGTYATITITNANTTNSTITAYLNGASIGTGIAVLSTVTNLTFSDLQDNLVEGTNTFTLASSVDNVAVNNTALYYNYGFYDESQESVVAIATLIIVLGVLIGMASQIAGKVIR